MVVRETVMTLLAKGNGPASANVLSQFGSAENCAMRLEAGITILY